MATVAMWVGILGVLSLCTTCKAIDEVNSREEGLLSITDNYNILSGGDNETTTATTTPSYDESEEVIIKTTTEEPDPPYLTWDYSHLSREEFWSENKYECVNGSLVPSQYLRRKYRECERIHLRVNPLCTINCQMAISMLLSERNTPNLELFTKHFELVLPQRLLDPIGLHYRKCFDTYGQNEADFLDNDCVGPQRFYTCVNEFNSQMSCEPLSAFEESQIILPKSNSDVGYNNT